MAEVNVEEINQGKRKKEVRPRKIVAERNKKYVDKDPLGVNFVRPCNHPRKSLFKCSELTIADVLRNKKLFYSHVGKEKQDVYLCRFISPFPPQRHRASTCKGKPKPRKFSTTYFLLKKKKMVQVCKKHFMKVYGLGLRRLHTIAKTVVAGQIPKENRGGDRKAKKFAQKKESVITFIKKLKAVESHYNRQKSKRIYLPCDLNMAKLRRMYNNTVSRELQVRPKFFRNIFLTNFNIGFKSPASDVCGVCTLLKNRLKSENDPQKKLEIMTQKRVHILKANAFYDAAKKTDNDSITFCFDLQQIHPLPKDPIQDAYYSRQISYYTFCVVGMKSLSPHFYVWTENQAGKGSVEIGSALISYLTKTLVIGPHIKVLRLFCDGCGGQNKNSHIMHTLLYWLTKMSPPNIQEIHLTFPVRGHSFLPADRVFGRVGNELKVHPVIVSQDEYNEIYSKFGEVHKLGEHWELYDIKGLEKFYKKIDKIQDLKRIHFKKVTVNSNLQGRIQTFENFKFSTGNEPFINLLKKRLTYDSVTLNQLQIGRLISRSKVNDVISLLKKIYGEEWVNDEKLQWYKSILLTDEDYGEIGDDEEEMETLCDCTEPEPVCLHI